MKMTDCPKFDRCSALICPLDADWAARVHLKGERICFYLLEYVKPGAKARFRGSTAREIYEAIQFLLPRILSRYAPLKRALRRAVRTGSRMGKRPGKKINKGKAA